MNYFAHGLRFLDRPYFLAGTAVPDWLSVVDRRVRLRERRVQPYADQSRSPQAELAGGVLQHLHDDGWFHQSRAFVEVSGQLTRLFRDLLGPEDGFRPSFLGHITTELLLDALLMERHREKLDGYYAALAQVDPGRVEAAVNQMARHQTSRLAPFVPQFIQVEFLREYRTAEGMLFRLNQVMRRIKLKPLPDATAGVLDAARPLVRERMDQLLPETHFH